MASQFWGVVGRWTVQLKHTRSWAAASQKEKGSGRLQVCKSRYPDFCTLGTWHDDASAIQERSTSAMERLSRSWQANLAVDFDQAPIGNQHFGAGSHRAELAVNLDEEHLGPVFE